MKLFEITKKISSLLIISLSIFMHGCGAPGVKDVSQPIEGRHSFIKAYNFNSFRPPRNGDGAGTIITFNKRGEEAVVYSADSCLLPSSVPAKEFPALIDNTSYEIERDGGIEWNLGKYLSPKFDLSGAINFDFAQKIKFKLVNPKIIRIELGNAEDYLDTLDTESGCRKKLSREGYLIIHSVLAAEGIEYSFYNKNDTGIKLTAKILQEIGIDLDGQNAVINDSTLVMKGNMFYGYRAWQASQIRGILFNQLSLSEVQPDSLEKMRFK